MSGLIQQDVDALFYRSSSWIVAMLIVFLTGFWGVAYAENSGLSQSQAWALARKYFREKDPDKKAALLETAGTTTVKRPEQFIKYMLPSGWPRAKPGVRHGLTLKVPSEVSLKPVEYSISIPSKYAPNRLWPLIIGLHGGGEQTGSGRDHMQSSMEITRLDTFFVCPTSVDRTAKRYWRNIKNEAMFNLLIKHLSRQYCIDPNRIYLSGYSMGGNGCYYHGMTMTQRFAAVAPGGGGWYGIYWPGMLNTPVYLWHGKKDMRGKMFTDFPYAENAALYLKELKYDYHLAALDSGHSPLPPGTDRDMAKWLLTKKRDPYPKRIVMASPRAKASGGIPVEPASPDRWLAIDKIGSKKLEMDSVKLGGTPRVKIKIKMGTLDAKWTAPNRLDVKAKNVKQFRIFLSPKLMNPSKPLVIMVNGKPAFEGPVKTSLKFLLSYLDKHRDPTMLYIGEVAITIPGEH